VVQLALLMITTSTFISTTQCTPLQSAGVVGLVFAFTTFITSVVNHRMMGRICVSGIGAFGVTFVGMEMNRIFNMSGIFASVLINCVAFVRRGLLAVGENGVSVWNAPVPSGYPTGLQVGVAVAIILIVVQQVDTRCNRSQQVDTRCR
jgi:hypothetical protein